jgi:hypothetical protein
LTHDLRKLTLRCQAAAVFAALPATAAAGGDAAPVDGASGLRAASVGAEGAAAGACDAPAPALFGRLDVDGAGGLRLDRLVAEVHLEHKLDVDEAEDRCITAVEVRGQLDPRGCRVALRYAASPAHERLQLQAARIEADSFCPGWADALEGVYTLTSGPRAEARLSTAAVSERAASLTCVDPMELELDGTFTVQRDGDPRSAREVELRAARVTGALPSVGETEARCPRPPPPDEPRPEREPAAAAYTPAPSLMLAGGLQLRDELYQELGGVFERPRIAINSLMPALNVRVRVEERDGERRGWAEIDYRSLFYWVTYEGEQSQLISNEAALRGGLWTVGAADRSGTRLGLRAAGALLQMPELEGAGYEGSARGFVLVVHPVGQVGVELQVGGERVVGTLLSDVAGGSDVMQSLTEARLGLRVGEHVELAALAGLDARRSRFDLVLFGATSTDVDLRMRSVNTGLSLTVR